VKDDFYKSIVKQSPDGYAYNKIICDKDGLPCDYMLMEVNLAFENLVGLKSKEIIGKKATVLFTQTLNEVIKLISIFGKVAIKCKSDVIEQFIESKNRWYRINVFSPEKYYFILSFNDITYEKQQLLGMNRCLELSQDFLCITNKKGYFLKVNSEWESLFGHAVNKLES